jgi:hypothetical protein
MDQSDATPSGDVALLIDWGHIKRSLQDEDLKPISGLAESVDSPERHRQVADRYAELGQWPHGLDHLEQAIRPAPDRLDLRGVPIVVFGRAGRVKQAIESGHGARSRKLHR